jgi:NADH:ubiquinone oxidoreductase subunit E
MASATIAEMRSAHEILAEFSFDPVKLHRGYANRSLRIDITKNTIEIKPVDEQMKELWIGGKGFDLWLTLQEINKDTKWESPENPICMSSGPLGGTTSFPGSGKTIVTAISPLTSTMIDCNVGGYFGPFLKFTGFDAMTIVGKSKDEIIIYIDAVKRKITIEKAPKESVDAHVVSEELTEMYADNEMDRKNIAVIAAGRGANHTRMGVLNFSFYDWRRGVSRLKQAGRGGVGTVFRDKKIKAIAIKNDEMVRPWKVEENKVAKMTTENICDCKDKKSDKQMIEDIIGKWNKDTDYVIEMMQDIQEKERFISKDAIDTISTKTGVPKATLYHIATFYKAFSLSPRGETLIQVCMGTACHVKGAPKILDSFERVLNIKQGETTKDEKYSLEAVACIGCCSIAPVVKVGEEVIGNVQSKDVPKIIDAASSRPSSSQTKGGEINA